MPPQLFSSVAHPTFVILPLVFDLYPPQLFSSVAHPTFVILPLVFDRLYADRMHRAWTGHIGGSAHWNKQRP